MSLPGTSPNTQVSILDAIAAMHASLIASIPKGVPPPRSPVFSKPPVFLKGSFINFVLPVDKASISFEATQANQNPSAKPASQPPFAVTTFAIGEETGQLPPPPPAPSEPNLLEPPPPPPPPPAITLERGEEGSLFSFDEPRDILLS